jgi:hypothetical protein
MMLDRVHFCPVQILVMFFSRRITWTLKLPDLLWEGAKIDINWKVGWSLNKNTTLSTNEFGEVFVSNVNASGSLARSFLTLPPSLFLSVFNSGIKRVNELYNPKSPDAASSLSECIYKTDLNHSDFCKIRISWKSLPTIFQDQTGELHGMV